MESSSSSTQSKLTKLLFSSDDGDHHEHKVSHIIAERSAHLCAEAYLMNFKGLQRVILGFGALAVSHYAQKDLQEAKSAYGRRNRAAAMVFFAAAGCDAVDAVIHFLALVWTQLHHEPWVETTARAAAVTAAILLAFAALFLVEQHEEHHRRKKHSKSKHQRRRRRRRAKKLAKKND